MNFFFFEDLMFYYDFMPSGNLEVAHEANKKITGEV